MIIMDILENVRSPHEAWSTAARPAAGGAKQVAAAAGRKETLGGDWSMIQRTIFMAKPSKSHGISGTSTSKSRKPMEMYGSVDVMSRKWGFPSDDMGLQP